MLKAITIIILGKPGCGKGTQAEILAKKLKAKSLGTGELLRDLAKEKTYLAKRLNPILTQGQLVPTWLASFVWIRELAHINPRQNIILDGSPRTLEEAKILDAVLAWYGRKDKIVILIDISAKESLRRLQNRKTCISCRKVSQAKNYLDIEKFCRICKGKLIRRVDDHPGIIKKRLDIFTKDVNPILGHYRAQKLLRVVDGEREIYQISKDVLDIINYAG